MKNIIVITGGAGFVGSNLIEYFVRKTNYKIISIDNYSSGNKKNHIKNKKVKYIKAHTKDIHLVLNRYKHHIKTIFHFGEFSRIFQSFLYMNKCIEANTIGTVAVFNFCLNNKIKLILVGSISIISIQALIHIGVNIRLFPTTGMTLPFLSYGGSSIIGTSILAGIILNLTKRKINT